MATTLNLGNIKGDTGDVGPTGLTPVITANTGANVPVDTQGTATADTTDPDNPIITFGLPIGATGATPVITASATGLANGETPTATADTTDPANPSIAFGIPAGDQGIQGETGPTGPAGSASIFLSNSTTTIRVCGFTSNNPGATDFSAYETANSGSYNGFARQYTADILPAGNFFTGGVPTTGAIAEPVNTFTFFENDLNGNPLDLQVGVDYVFTDGTYSLTINLTDRIVAAANLPPAADFGDIGFQAWHGALTNIVGTSATLDQTGFDLTSTIVDTVAVAGQVFAQGAFTIDNQTTPASLYIKRSIGTVTTAEDNASLPDVNTTDFQPITLP